MMATRARKRPRGGFGLVAALLAVFLQVFVLAGAMPMPDPAGSASIDHMVICGAGHTASPASSRHHHSLPLRCASCPGCQLAAHAGAPLTQLAPALFVPYPAAVLPPSTAGPTFGKNAPSEASLPRGPPAFA